MPDDQIDVAGADLPEEGPARGARDRAGQQRHLETRVGQQPLNRAEVLLGQQLGRRHEGHLLAVLHRQQRGEDGHDRLPGSDVALQQPVHRLRLLHVFADVLQRAPLSLRQMERQHAPERGADRVVHARDQRLQLALGFAPPQQQTDLEAKELFEDQAPLRWRPKGVERVERGGRRRKVGGGQGLLSRGHPQRRAHGGGQHIVEIGWKPGQHVGHQATLHLRRNRLDPLVDGNDAAAMDRLDIVVLDDLELRVGDLEPCPLIALERAVDNESQSRPDSDPSSRRS